jgi:opacity protein-like surface antigen
MRELVVGYFGGGVAWANSQNWMANIEYRHAEFDTRHATAYSGCSAANTTGCNSGVLVCLWRI